MAAETSLAALVRALPEAERRKLLDALSAPAAEELRFAWRFWARPSQLSPWSPARGAAARAAALARWTGAVWICGRGYGKTRIGAESTIEEARADPTMRASLIGRTAADVRDVMVEGESGILARSPPSFRPVYEPSKRRLRWPNGATATTFSADQPDQLRGPQSSWIWADEIAAWQYRDTWDQARFGLRLGAHPRFVATTTPRPTSIVRELLADERVRVVRGSTYDNAANLAPDYLSQIRRRYEGTTLGRQEIHAEVFDESPGALWQRARLDSLRAANAPPLVRVVVAIDPAVTAGEDSDETGIVVAGVCRDRALWVLEDASGRMSPGDWATRAIDAYRRHKADRIVAEANNGGDMVADVLRTRDRSAAVTLVHASRGKLTRAEPVSALYEQGRAHHVGVFRELEDQLCTWVPGMGSPDRLDALVWAGTELVIDAVDVGTIAPTDGLDREWPLDAMGRG